MRESDFARLLTNYLSKFLPSQRNLSTNTIKSYRDTFRLFLIYCQDQEGIKAEKLYLAGINDRMILSYLDWIEQTAVAALPPETKDLQLCMPFSGMCKPRPRKTY